MKGWDRVPDYWFASRRHYFLKNHGRLYLAAVTAAHVAGAGLGALWRIVRRKGTGRPPHFLRDLVLGDLGATLRGTGKRKADA